MQRLPSAEQDPFRIPSAARILLVLALLFLFLVAIQMLGSSIKLMGSETAGELVRTFDNPFAALAVGVLATVLVQSSSTTTSTIVGLVGSGSATAMSVTAAVPMIMGANIGTTVTNTIVSVGHVRKSAEFKRAFAAATVHDFFNLLCVITMLPLEIATGFLAKSATGLTDSLFGAGGGSFSSPVKTSVKAVYKWTLGHLEGFGLEDMALAITVLLLGVALTFVCLIFITKNMRVMISGPLERAMNRALGRSGLIGILVGIAVTVAVQSSSITTSLLVPMCAAGILTLPNAFPIMLGANIGTTVTALLASMATDQNGLTIAIVHLLFNLLGVLIFYPIKSIRMIPIRLAEGLAERSAGNPFWLIAYMLTVFVGVPLVGYWIFR
jgi:solute carrier family 34 (sodium-dependent phosphate cotransporter)